MISAKTKQRRSWFYVDTFCFHANLGRNNKMSRRHRCTWTSQLFDNWETTMSVLKDQTTAVLTLCNNTKGSYRCTYKPGFHGDGLMCKGKIFKVWVNKFRVDLSRCILAIKGAYTIMKLETITHVIDVRNREKLFSDFDEYAKGSHSCRYWLVCWRITQLQCWRCVQQY